MSLSQPARPEARLGAIQALRTIAAALVVLQHVTVHVLQARGVDFRPFLKVDLGRAGVLLFFVISGFVMAGCLREGRAFLLNRALRIYPGFWLAAAITFLLLGSVYGPLSYLLLPHVPGAVPYSIPYWTLMYEVVFYVVTYAFILARFDRRRITAALLAWLACVVVASRYQQVDLLLPGSLWTWASPLNGFYILGMLAALYRDELARVASPWLALVAIVGWTCGDALKADPMASQVTLAVAWTSLLLLGLRFRWPAVLERLGDYSYGLYLLHVPLIGAVVLSLGGSGLRLSALYLVALVASMVGGLAFGWLEFRLHRAVKRLRPKAARAEAAGPVRI